MRPRAAAPAHLARHGHTDQRAAEQRPRARAHQRTSCRAVSAWASVTRVDVLQVAAHRQAAREPGHPHRVPGEQLLNVGRRHLALHRWIGGEDDLAHAVLLAPGGPAGPCAAPRARRLRAATAGRRARGSAPGSRSRGPPPAPPKAPRPRRAGSASRRGSAQMAQALVLGEVAALCAGTHPLGSRLTARRPGARPGPGAAAAGGR